MRKLTLEAQATGRPLGELLDEAQDLAPYVANLTAEQRSLLHDPRLYTGIATEKTEVLCAMWEQRLSMA